MISTYKNWVPRADHSDKYRITVVIGSLLEERHE